MIFMKNLRFSSCPRAKVRGKRPPGSARAQPWLNAAILKHTIQACVVDVSFQHIMGMDFFGYRHLRAPVCGMLASDIVSG